MIGTWLGRGLTCLLLLAGCTAPPRHLADRSEIYIYAVGDIADCALTPPAQSGAAATAALLRATAGWILALGDLAYPDGSAADFRNCFDPVWGDLTPRILPAPGNHEYRTPGAAGYYDYFGAAAGERGKGYYATRVGGWRIIALNSNIDMSAGSEQERWLSAQLASEPTRCTLAFWHHPRFSSAPRGTNLKLDAIWRTLYAAGVDVVLNGHEHVYEHFAPQTPDGYADDERGMRQFVVGTGGAKAGQFNAVQPNSEARERGILGVLRLALRPDGYAWRFLPAVGHTFEDSGQGRCH